MPALDSLFEALKFDHLAAQCDALLEQFDFSFQPPIDCKVVRKLGTLGFVGRAQNVVLLGPPGVDKTHLAIGLAVKAAEVGHRVLFLTLEQLMGKLKRARQENRLERQLQQLTYPKVCWFLTRSATCPCRRRACPEPVSSTGQALIQGCQPAVPSAGAALREGIADPDEQQELRGLGRHLQRCGVGDGNPGLTATPLDGHQHQGRELPAGEQAQGGHAQRAGEGGGWQGCNGVATRMGVP